MTSVRLGGDRDLLQKRAVAVGRDSGSKFNQCHFEPKGEIAQVAQTKYVRFLICIRNDDLETFNL